MRYSTILSAAAALLIGAAAVQASAQDGKLTLEDIYRNYEYSAKGVSAFRWAEDGHSFLTIERGTRPQEDRTLSSMTSGPGRRQSP